MPSVRDADGVQFAFPPFASVPVVVVAIRLVGLPQLASERSSNVSVPLSASGSVYVAESCGVWLTYAGTEPSAGRSGYPFAVGCVILVPPSLFSKLIVVVPVAATVWFRQYCT